MRRPNRPSRYGLCAAKRKCPGSIRSRNGADGPRDPQRIAMAGTGPPRGRDSLVSGSPPSGGAPRDSRQRDSRSRAALLHDGGRTSTVLQDPADRARRRDAVRSGADVRLIALCAPGPWEVGLRRREDRAEDPDDAANLARGTAVVRKEDSDEAGDDGSVHQVFASHRSCNPKRSAEDDVDNQDRHNIAELVRRNPWRGRPWNTVVRGGHEDGDDA